MTSEISDIVSSVANGTISPADAANKIRSIPAIASSSLPADGNDTPDAEGFFWDLWGSVIDTAQAHPNKQDRLVKLVAELARDPPETTWRVWEREYTWKDLPILGPTARESYNGFDPLNSEEVENWVQLNAFLARLTGAKELFMLYAIWAMRSALEDEPSHNAVENSGNIRAAAQWIKYAGEKIYNSTEEFESGPQIGAPARGGAKWSGKQGFDPQRWALWEKEFTKFSNDASVDEAAREAAKEAAQRMKQIGGNE